MDTKTLGYCDAKQIYLDIYDHQKVIAKYLELGLTLQEAKELASKISQNIADYEIAIDTYKRDLYGGIALTIIGVVSFFIEDSLIQAGYINLRILKFSLLAGLRFIWTAYLKRKTITTYESC